MENKQIVENTQNEELDLEMVISSLEDALSIAENPDKSC